MSDHGEPPAVGGVDPPQRFNVVDETCNLAQWELDVVVEHAIISGADDACHLESLSKPRGSPTPRRGWFLYICKLLLPILDFRPTNGGGSLASLSYAPYE